ncbi:hypothetical protein PP178_03930 [Zeaxanthinibacter sp. PT1]|uniref:hypothetical protein n=1 Tax=Zeaxanthinibacter TaxID=561554 RepID=UPI00234BCD23|nr:hypothetical protein [Zeaxanthinibacter sp. PT1]MDC6350689.1 hypothetical protein [Zeaxanthinibacter sp. PT1]
MEAPTLQARSAYANTTEYYNAITWRYKYIATEWAKKTLYGVCSPHLEEMLCLRAKIWELQLELGIDQIDSPAAPGSAIPIPGNEDLVVTDSYIHEHYLGYYSTGGAVRLSDIIDELDNQGVSITGTQRYIVTALVDHQTQGATLDRYLLYKNETEKLVLLESLPISDQFSPAYHMISGSGSPASIVNQASTFQANPKPLIVQDVTSGKLYGYLGTYYPEGFGATGYVTQGNEFVEITPFRAEGRTSDLINDGENGQDPFITSDEAQVLIDDSLENYYDKPEIDAMLGGAVDAHYVHNQTSDSNTWAITHNLGKMPSVVVIDDQGNNVEGEITYTSTNGLVITFNNPFQGTAYLN